MTFIAVSGWILACIFGVFLGVLFYRSRRSVASRTAALEKTDPDVSTCDADGGARFRSIFSSISVGYFRAGVGGRVYEVNPALVAMLGYSSLCEMIISINGSSLGFYRDPADRMKIIGAILSGGKTGNFSVDFIKKDRTVIPCSITANIIRNEKGEPLYLEGICEDISASVKMQAIMIRAEKMTTIAGLAAGMAHEINNPLGIIMQMAENTERRLLLDIPANREAAVKAGLPFDALAAYVRERKIDHYLGAIRDAGERAARLVESMLQFSRRSDSHKTEEDLNRVIDAALDIATKDYDLKKRFNFNRIAIRRIKENIPSVYCVEPQIKQVFVNILRNAAEAMEGKDDPEIEIKSFYENGEVKVRIANNGSEMAESIRQRMFEPFFTTKPEGEGSGLGMSVAYYIVVNGHSGRIEVESGKGKKTAFTVIFPPDGGAVGGN